MQPAARPAGAFDVTHRMVLGLALPMTFGFLTIPLLGLTSTAVAGRLGDANILAGLSIGAVLFDLIFASCNFLRASTTALVAQAWGRGDGDEQEAVFWRAMLLAIAIGAAIVILSPLLLKLGLLVMAPDPGAGAAASHSGLRSASCRVRRHWPITPFSASCSAAARRGPGFCCRA
jgi:MATE family multidrug resistance protein